MVRLWTAPLLVRWNSVEVTKKGETSCLEEMERDRREEGLERAVVWEWVEARDKVKAAWVALVSAQAAVVYARVVVKQRHIREACHVHRSSVQTAATT